MRKHVRWYHTYSHCLETLNELVDDLVLHGAVHTHVRQQQMVVPCLWCRNYTVEQIKLL